MQSPAIIMRFQFLFALALGAMAAGCAQHLATDDYPYHDPLSSPGMKLGGVPPAVQRTIRAEVGAAEIYDIQKKPGRGSRVYKVILANSELYPPLYVRSDGSVLYPNLEVAVSADEDDIGAVSGGPVGGLRLSDLPIDVAKTVQEKAPTAEVGFIRKITAGDRTLYEISFKGNAHPSRMVLSETGVLVESVD